MPSPIPSGLTPADAASCLPHKTFQCEVKALDESTGSFELYAACFGNVDRQGDMIEPGAFQNLPEFVSDGWIALNHDQAALPLAIVDTAEQDGKGLRVTGRFHTHAQAQSCRAVIIERMAAGKRVLCSIGYLVPLDGEHYERENGQNVRHISKLSVYEASIVNLPANPLADVQSIKSMKGKTVMPELAHEGVVEAFKAFVDSLASKGGMLPKSAHYKLKSVAEAMDEHGKCSKEHGKAACAIAKDMKETLKSLVGGQREDEEDSNVAGKEDEDEKEDKPESEEEGDGKEDEDDKKPKGKKKEDETEEDKTKKAYREQLKRRALAGRRFQQCP